MSSTKLSPSYFGYVGSTKDALLIIQATLNRQLGLIPRRPHERERSDLIRSGNVFIFIEEHSGIKRWTDGISWSPSRILGRFLVYRELDKDSLQDDKKFKNRKRKSSLTSEDIDSISPLVGSQHGFKDHGLIKKTLSINTTLKELNLSHDNTTKQTIHLISYYSATDVTSRKLLRPSESDLKNVHINGHLWSAIKESNLGGKITIEDEAHYFLDNNYQLSNMSMPMGTNATNNNKYSAPPPPPPPVYYQKNNFMLSVPSNYDYYGSNTPVTNSSVSGGSSTSSTSSAATSQGISEHAKFDSSNSQYYPLPQGFGADTGAKRLKMYENDLHPHHDEHYVYNT
ncbi:Global transcription regulator sge1 [Yamadazyma tenuis]|uniref:Global transcription regulator sge1 n=1 Tax=Candida tenuis TaxID=2315449 RepID=UPI0027A3D1B5|nr:Global transcription regulator sge1 [Yamadazyma tenuis]